METTAVSYDPSDVLAHRSKIRENRSPAEEGTKIRAGPEHDHRKHTRSQRENNRGERDNELTKDRERATQI